MSIDAVFHFYACAKGSWGFPMKNFGIKRKFFMLHAWANGSWEFLMIFVLSHQYVKALRKLNKDSPTTENVENTKTQKMRIFYISVKIEGSEGENLRLPEDSPYHMPLINFSSESFFLYYIFQFCSFKLVEKCPYFFFRKIVID